jgi:hypothetical protein
MSSKKMTISDGLSAMAFGATMATGIIAGVEMEVPQSSNSNHEDREVSNILDVKHVIRNCLIYNISNEIFFLLLMLTFQK